MYCARKAGVLTFILFEVGTKMEKPLIIYLSDKYALEILPLQPTYESPCTTGQATQKRKN
jgi:hypothetical protein